MYKIITITENRVLVDYFERLEHALAIYNDLLIKVEKKQMESVVLVSVAKNPRDMEILKYCFR